MQRVPFGAAVVPRELIAASVCGAVVLYAIVSGLCLALPSSGTAIAGGELVPESSECVRALRRPSVLMVHLAMGTPPRVVRVLFRPGEVVDHASDSLRLFGARIVESRSLYCASPDNETCFDRQHVSSGGPERATTAVVTRFAYGRRFASAEALSMRDVDGELFAVAGRSYYLTSTHLCVAPFDADAYDRATAASARASACASDQVEIAPRTLLVDARSLLPMLHRSEGVAPVLDALRAKRCVSQLQSMQLFPIDAAFETTFLALRDRQAYDNEPAAVSMRRRVAELGSSCAVAMAAHEAPMEQLRLDGAVNAYALDAYDMRVRAREAPSVPFWRVAHHTVFLAYAPVARERLGCIPVLLRTQLDPALAHLLLMADASAALDAALAKLATLLLAAAVVWMRSHRPSSSAMWLVHAAVHHGERGPRVRVGRLVEDGLIGLCTSLARLLMARYRWIALVHDAQARACALSFVGALTSIVSWVCRFFVVHPGAIELAMHPSRFGADLARNNPLGRLGGSMAIVDATCAALLAFAEPPLCDARTTFDDTARLLLGVLIGLVVVPRCAFAIACNVACARRTAPSAYKTLCAAHAALWIVQLVGVAFGVADLIVMPLAHALGRTASIDQSVLGVALMLGTLALALPKIILATAEIAKARRDR
jgi:hypothetical protein